MTDKVERMGAALRDQQLKIEGLTERVIRLATAREIALSPAKATGKAPRRLTHKD